MSRNSRAHEDTKKKVRTSVPAHLLRYVRLSLRSSTIHSFSIIAVSRDRGNRSRSRLAAKNTRDLVRRTVVGRVGDVY